MLIMENRGLDKGDPGYQTYEDIVEVTNTSLSYVRKQASDMNAGGANSTASGSSTHVAWESRSFPHPIELADLAPEPARALEDIEYFARRFYGIVLLPWQVDAASRIVHLLGTPYEEYAVVNVAPGSGKSVFFGRILPAWLTCRDRSMRGMIGSATNTVATKLVDQLRRDFIRPKPDRLSGRDLRMGMVQMESTLPLDYGRFRPDVDGSLWTRGEFEVAQHGDEFITQKEPTWAAFGKDTTFIGWRAEFVLWDDLWDVRKVRSLDAREEFFEWFENTAETRLEPGGLFLLQGQRLAADDIYAHALAKPADLTDGEMEELGLGPEDEMPGRYHHISYKAYNEELDTGPESLKPESPPWPDGPLLSPTRLPWRRLRGIRAASPDLFSLTYQQDATNLTETLINPLWIYGGVGEGGQIHPGCVDKDRRLWEVPANLAEPVVSVAMTDPSGTNQWGHLWYLWQPALADHDQDMRHVMAIDWRKMSADQFLDFNQRTGEYHGLMEDWWQTSQKLGRPIRWWIIEQNAAQRYLLQYEHVRQWQIKRGVTIIAHNTHSNKIDPAYGVDSLAPVFQRGLIRIPFKDAESAGAQRSMKAVDFITQLKNYGGVGKTKDDLVMAAWFFENKRDSIRPASGPVTRLARPAFVSNFKAKQPERKALLTL